MRAIGSNQRACPDQRSAPERVGHSAGAAGRFKSVEAIEIRRDRVQRARGRIASGYYDSHGAILQVAIERLLADAGARGGRIDE